jgi:hypothetical protein
MLPSYTVQIFNTLLNVVEAGLLVYIAIEKHLNNQFVKQKQFDTNNRLDHIFYTLQAGLEKVNTPKKGNK